MSRRLLGDVYAGDTDWKARSLCGVDDHHLFFPAIGRSDLAARAKELCGRCAVRVECLDYALTTQQTNYDSGVWGGTTPTEREAIRRRLRRAGR